MHVLVMSPSGAARRLLELMIEGLGHSCVTTADGDEALASLGAIPPGLIFVDERAGLEDTLVLSALLQKRHPAVPRLVLQAGELRVCSGGTEKVLRFSAAGGAAFPSRDEVSRALTLVEAEQLLAAWSPPAAKA